VSIQPEDVALVVEPISFVPPLYPGKASVPIEGGVRVVAVANLKDAKGKASLPSTYSYTWTVNGIRMMNDSGIGKSIIMVPVPSFNRELAISVAVTNGDGTLVGGDSASVSGVSPTLRVYESDPLLGIRFDHAISSTFTINGAESTLYAAPFSLPLTNGLPAIQWFLNDSPVQSGSVVTLRPTGSGSGTAGLSLTATAGTNTSVSAQIFLTFGAPARSNSFGL
jgi:hypothetical protein